MTEDMTNTQTRQPPKPNPALNSLEVFAGDWDMQVSRASFLPDPSDTIGGYATFEWFEQGAFLVIHQGEKPHPPFSTWIIGRDESTEIFKLRHSWRFKDLRYELQ